MSKMTSVQLTKPREFETVEKEIPTPGANQVRIKIKATGVCHSDCFTVEGSFPGVKFPRVPGHEVAGIIDEIGEGITTWKKDQRVGVGWSGMRCSVCTACRRGDFQLCSHHQITGIHYDGGYEQYMIAPVEALAHIPDELSFEEAAPLMCAGVTTFNALRHTQAKAGDIVAIQGIGGLGHLAIQFASKMGFKTIAISKGSDKAALAKELGAHIFIDTDKENAVNVLRQLGGARVILATAPNGKAISSLIEGLGNEGQLMIVGAAADPIQVNASQLIRRRGSICGWPSGTSVDSEDAMRFCALTGIRPMIEVFPLEKAKEAYECMMSNKARFRCVLKIG